MLETSVFFESGLFRPYLPDEQQIDFGVYGAELAFWLSQQLAAVGIVCSYPHRDACGWYLNYQTERGRYRLWCCNDNHHDARWHCYLQPIAKGLFARPLRNLDDVRPLLRALDSLLVQEPQISNVIWRYQPHF